MGQEPHILGHLGSAEGRGTVRIEHRLGAPVEEVWSALTDPASLERWLGTVEGDLRVGSEFRAFFHATGWEGTGRVEVCDRLSRLLVVTRDHEQPDEAFIEVTLTADGDGTAVVWEERGMPLDLLTAYGAGIQIHVEDLADHVAGLERRDAGPRFDPLWAAYRKLNGEAPSTT